MAFNVSSIRMKATLFIVTLLVSTSLFAQNRDDSLVHSLNQQFDLTQYDKPSERIEFNRDTIVIAGYLGNPSNSSKKNVVYKTMDGGTTWKAIEFNGDAWIYNTYHTQDGKIWMGGSDNFIHHSDDFGETWKRRIKPFKPVDRVLSIFMIDSVHGIAGGLSNGLAITSDNWNSSTQVKSPIDQNKFKILKVSARGRVSKIAIIDSLILINQNDYIFYSKINDLKWEKFNIPVSSFLVDEQKKEIDLLSRDGKHFVIGSDLILKRSYQKKYESPFLPIREDTTQIDLTEFLKSPITSLKIESTKYEFDRQSHMQALYTESVQLADVHLKDKTFYFKAKGSEKRGIQLNQDSLNELLSTNLHVRLDELSKSLKFSEADYLNYETVLTREAEERAEQDNWGGNPTSQIGLENPLFNDYKMVTSTINQEYLRSVYSHVFMRFLLDRKRNSISVNFKNEKNEEVIISNASSNLYSLPWSITYMGVTVKSYNPKLTEL
ncbi:MAG: hypothetical protein ACI837_003565, partial [Crocinitomicaceae bacterium]